MIDHSLFLPLLAQVNRLQGISSGFRGDDKPLTAVDVAVLLFIFGALAAGIWVLGYVARRDRRRAYRSESRLFRELCRTHGLKARDSTMLKRLARDAGLASPSELFVIPDHLDGAIAAAANRGESARLRELRSGLFRI